MRISVLTPCYDTNCKIYFTKSLMETVWPDGADVTFLTSIGSWLPNAMTSMVRKSMQCGADYIIMASADIAWNPHDIARLIGHGKDVCCGWASGRTSPFTCHIADKYNEAEHTFHVISNPTEHSGLERVAAVGGELNVYKADVFRRIPDPWFWGPDNMSIGRLMTEDYYFASQAHKHDVEIWVDWSVALVHCIEGMATCNGNMVSVI
jgi:hypothetical protein